MMGVTYGIPIFLMRWIMGLLVWLPLDGTLENKGVSNITANV